MKSLTILIFALGICSSINAAEITKGKHAFAKAFTNLHCSVLPSAVPSNKKDQRAKIQKETAKLNVDRKAYLAEKTNA